MRSFDKAIRIVVAFAAGVLIYTGVISISGTLAIVAATFAASKTLI